MLLSTGDLHAREGDKAGGMPPARVVVSEVGRGMVTPENELVGTVYYTEVSDVASEVSGIVEIVFFEEGQTVEEGAILVTLSSDLLQKTLEATRASLGQALAEYEKAARDYERIASLYLESSVAEQVYDEHRFRVQGLEKKVQALEAEVERIELELGKKSITAPFRGVVVERHAERGEWLSPGAPVATIARDDVLDVIVDVPEAMVSYVREGMEVKVKAGGKETVGSVEAVIPKGDVSTRTFPVKIRVQQGRHLMEGMEARVWLPSGERKEALMVPRDALITVFGKTVLFAVVGSEARMIPVKVIGYEGMTAGVSAERLRKGMRVVVKGQERLRDGQRVEVIGSK